ncbi:MAG TPA: hypothetical protein DGG94_22760 [Micromonosporaceae bacterium]|nr:hypothetical protein [Micromonosporaceae bacterium]HCU52577.1 hypothetical protein [Micromonosporaceae bacterium]
MPNRVRVIAFLCGLLAIALRLAEKFWLEPWSWRFDQWPVSLLLFMNALVLAMLIPFAIFGLLTWRMRGKPVPLQVDTRRRWFVAKATPHLGGFWAILLMWIGGGAIMTERVPNQEAVRVAHLPGAVAISVVGVLLFAAGAVALLFSNTVRVVLEPESVHVRQLWMSGRVKWDDVVHVEQVRTGLNLWRRTSRLSLGVPLLFLQVDPEVLTRAIRTYVQQPERRAAIGTFEELQRLLPPATADMASERA